jgi:hypothetical protein
MKVQLSTSFVPVTRDALASLVKQVPETLAKNNICCEHKSLRAADLWNIQRNKKPVGLRKHYL